MPFLYRIHEENFIEECSKEDLNSDDLDHVPEIPILTRNVQRSRWTTSTSSSSDKEDISKKKYPLARKIRELRPELEKQKQGMENIYVFYFTTKSLILLRLKPKKHISISWNDNV